MTNTIKLPTLSCYRQRQDGSSFSTSFIRQNTVTVTDAPNASVPENAVELRFETITSHYTITLPKGVTLETEPGRDGVIVDDYENAIALSEDEVYYINNALMSYYQSSGYNTSSSELSPIYKLVDTKPMVYTDVVRDILVLLNDDQHTFELRLQFGAGGTFSINVPTDFSVDMPQAQWSIDMYFPERDTYVALTNGEVNRINKALDTAREELNAMSEEDEDSGIPKYMLYISHSFDKREYSQSAHMEDLTVRLFRKDRDSRIELSVIVRRGIGQANRKFFKTYSNLRDIQTSDVLSWCDNESLRGTMVDNIQFLLAQSFDIYEVNLAA